MHVDAPPAVVWALLCDVNLPARFSNEFLGAEWLDGANGPALGARFRGKNRHPAIGEWESVSVVTACEPERVLEWSVGNPDRPSAVWRFEIEPDKFGVILRQRAQMGPGRSGLNAAIDANPDREERIVERRLDEYRTNMEANLAGIRDLAHQAAGAG
jgi:hypothetical protein